ncbi:2-oxo acid dehydrogenase subunit E2 [Rhodococcus sp. BP-252]|uniref:dihydrolipoamide acetyltransferase family protein n=1 Tax=unclassified Rhodococcus (in: high G+C Gram-positive bacteria) TaxID=192944 RepID=UPI00143172BC|nr:MULTISPECIES: dihydrolipoamide acetyltransferase family protein [unclassified Rhodococcus (in: high G+C Gram-positive bacteria)]MBY6410714.1 2-oxo acid dehydrogenase subunit E2 [Rhodococcus sp. BP-320]MBY6415461.1 2-oxo acid dehydrogenase subunit E2 [Rhodococcus sp. BP-321]MBY6420076.1 2-oxo acid dehydrogenase subunit E2 [Rhodococcus sp. BP-324]MBY6425270.1 2-oxo acid dehydrogenase subunit E2 [Rhodococcus sp. BP-323]MBY6430667.1 2-oxo acid dehydrogenase subunit E2 [Rhodococcus sp. BP-322]
MTKSFLLPDLGEGLTEAELITWLVQVGDTVELNQVIAEVETAKASVELPSPFAGTVLALHAEEGSTVEVGSTIIDIDTGEDAVTEERTPVLVGYGVAGEGKSRRGGRKAAAAPAPGDRPLASPPARFVARQEGVDLADVPATGTHGEVTRDDIAAYLTRPKPVEATTDETRAPIKGVRKHTAAAMVSSAFTAPHVTEFVTVDVTPTVELVEKLRANKHFQDVRLTPLALVAKALLVALRSNPSLNSEWDEANQEIVTKKYVNLGIAAATPRGLMVPNIKGAHALGLKDLAVALNGLTTTAKEGKTGPEDLADGTITITNVGVFGVDSGTPILNPGEAAILCFGAIRRQPWEFEGDIALRSVTTLSLSFDHRLVDGEQGSRFLADIAAILADPMNLVALA